MSKPRAKQLDLTDQLAQAFEGFQELAQYPLLKGLELSHLQPEFAGHKLQSSTLGDLVEQGAEGFAEKNEVDGDQIRLLVKLLSRFSDQPNTIANGVPADHIESSLQTVGAEDSEPQFISSELELELVTTVGRVRSHADFQRDAKKQLSEFWPKDATRSPFEECLTLKQLSEINLESVLKKRSFSLPKARALLAAVKNFLGNENTVAGEQHPEVAQVISMPVKPDSIWNEDGSKLDVSGRAIILFFNNQLHITRAHTSFWSQIFSLIQNGFSQAQFVNIWKSCESEGLSEITDKHQQKQILALLEQRLPGFYAHWKSLLRNPASSYSDFTKAYISPELDRSFQELLFQILLSTFAAQRVKLGKKVLKDFYSDDAQKLNKLLKLLKLDKKISKSLQKELAAVFPGWAEELIK